MKTLVPSLVAATLSQIFVALPVSSFVSTLSNNNGARWGNTVGARRRIPSSRYRSNNNNRGRRRRLTMVIDRMSDDAVGAIMVGHEIGNELGLRFLTNELIFLGVVNKPERAAMTLEKYGVKYPLAKRSAVKFLEKKGFRRPPAGKEDVPRSEEGEEDDKKKAALPFSDEAKTTLTTAAKIADYSLSTTVNSEHVLLALFAYNFGNPVSEGRVSTAREVLLGTEGFVSSLKIIDDEGTRKKFSSFDLCEELVRDMKKPYNPNNANDNKENESTPRIDQVAIGGGSGGGNTNTLDEVGIDLTQMAVEGAFDKVYGRDDEIRMALRTLGRRRKNNPCLIGDPGVGKTAIAEAIAQVLASSYEVVDEGFEFKVPEIKVPEINMKLPNLNPFKKKEDKQTVLEDDLMLDDDNEEEDMNMEIPQEKEYTLPPCPQALAGFRLIGIDLASLVAGTRNRGDFEEKVQKLIQEVSEAQNVILFIDELHNLVGTGGGGDGAMNAANLIKPALARGQLRLLGATTTSEYRKYIQKDGALERRFQPLDVVEPTVEETLEILKTVAGNYATYHGVEYTENSLVAAAKLSDRYIADRFLPDKAIDLVDEAGSMIKMAFDFDTTKTQEENDEANDYFVTEDDISMVVSEITGIPVGRLDTGEKERLLKLELTMGDKVKGQAQAVREVAKAIRRSRAGMTDANRPVCSLLFMGPTGVGKTELSKALAQVYYGGSAESGKESMVRIDMSEYMDRFSTTRLIGSPPGYVGYDEGGQLTEAVRRKPHSVILFDEIEKAHEDVLNVLLQVLDEGTLTDGKGRTVSFKNTIVVMTSNLGSKEMSAAAGNTDSGETTEEISKAQTAIVKKALEEALKPELRNRIDKFVYFNTLSYDNLEEIAMNIMDSTVERAKKDQEITLTVADNLIREVTKEAFAVSGEYGARPIRRAAQRYLEDTMSDAIMREFVNPGDEVVVEMENDGKPRDGQTFVKITKLDLEGRKESISLPVEGEGEMGSMARDLEWQAAFGDMPDDDGISSERPETETDNTWE